MKAERNKTIDFLPQDAPEYLARCLRVAQDVPLNAVCDRTICGDTFQVAPHLPRGFADLLIVDPPYNLTKEFAGGAFRRMTDANYAAFTRAWIRAAAAAAQAECFDLRLLRLALEPDHRPDAQGVFPAAKPHHMAAGKGPWGTA